MTRKTELIRLFQNAVILEMCLPYMEALPDEDETFKKVLTNLSVGIYGIFREFNTVHQTFSITNASEAYLNNYRETFGSISESNATDLVTVCIGCLKRNLDVLERNVPKDYKYLKRLITSRLASHKLDKDKALFAKGLNESLFKVAVKISEPA